MSCKTMLFVFALSSFLAGQHPRPAEACTSVLVTKGASQDGSTMISYSIDGEFLPSLRIIPAADHKPGAMKEIIDWHGVKKGEIPEVAHTYKVVGLINEHQLAIGETTFGGRQELINSEGLFHYYELMRTALERAKTARKAISVITSLAEKYGYRSEGESISIADKNEVWLLEIVGLGKWGKGAAWVAVRIPDGMVAVHANMSRIHEFRPDDPKNVKYSKNVVSFAIERGYYDPKSNKPFDFSQAYNPPTEEQVRYSDRRVWSVFRRISPSRKLSADYSSGVPGAAPYPLYIKPDKKLNVRDVIALHRDHYEGTQFDMTKDLTAGPFGAPDRARPIKWAAGDKKYVWERPISTQQVGCVYVSQCRAGLPDQIGAVSWYGLDNPYTNFFAPFYTSITEAPPSYATGDLNRFSRDSAWWALNFVANYANLKYSYMIKDIQKVQKEIEDREFALQPAIEKTARELLKKEPKLAAKFLTQYCVYNAESNIQKWWKLGDYLVTKYNDGYIQDEKGGPQEAGYPEQWLQNELKAGPSRKNLKQEKEADREL
jgi:dipeptidase